VEALAVEDLVAVVELLVGEEVAMGCTMPLASPVVPEV
jgi:hypothetical protein